MTITQEVTRKETVVKQIDLPYYSNSGSTFYRINEDESVLKVYINEDYANITLSKKSEYFPATNFRDAVEAPECTKSEMESAAIQAVEFIEQNIADLKRKKRQSVVDLAETIYRTH